MMVVALITFCTAWVTWLVGRRATLLNVLTFRALCGAAATVKYNALAAGVIAMALLTVRALMPRPWTLFGRVVAGRAARLLGVAVVGLIALLMTAAIAWACYGYRFEPARVPGERQLDLADQARQLSEADPSAQRLPLTARAALFMERHRLMPKSWLFGLISIYRSTTTESRQSYLMDEITDTGWWYYFPLATLCRAPLATVAALGIALAVLGALRGRTEGNNRADRRWAILCLAVPTALYALAAIT